MTPGSGLRFVADEAMLLAMRLPWTGVWRGIALQGKSTP
jgi:hypothetical protein